MKKLHVYRNNTIEYLFKNFDATYSGYGDTTILDSNDDSEILIFYTLPYSFSTKTLLSLIDSLIERVNYLTSNYAHKTIFAVTLYNYFFSPFVLGNDELEDKIHSYNKLLYSKENIRVIDISPFYTDHNNAFNSKYYYLYDAVVNPAIADDFQLFISQEVGILQNTRKKCLVLDLDNTLWGGIVGEDGIGNLQISGVYPGNCFHDFQELILELKQSGVILGICSKNNYDDVVECFKKRNDLVLSLDDFTIKKINWQEKRLNIAAIAKELNIGLDSIVFVDDNPVERENVKTLEEVVVLDFPKSPHLMPQHFAKEFRKYFGIYKLTEDDLNKSNQYEYKAKSEELKNTTSSKDDFIKKLNIKIICEKMNDNNGDRIAQLINKSNQFNLTTKRYDKKTLENMSDSLVLAIRVIDKFGDLGITGVAVARIIDTHKADIDTFLMSCRILGRDIEREFLKIVLNQLWIQGITEVTGEFIKSAKNAQVATFYSDNDFQKMQSDDRTTQKFSYKLVGPLKYDKKYKVEVKNG